MGKYLLAVLPLLFGQNFGRHFWFECAALLLLLGTDVRVETCVLGNVYLTMPEASVHEKDRLYSEETTAMQAFELASSSLFG